MMRKLLALLICLVVTASLFATGAAQPSASAAGATGPRVVTQVTPRPLTVTPQYGEQQFYPQPATSYSTTPRWPQQPAVSNVNGFPIVQQQTTMKIAIPYYSYVNTNDYSQVELGKYMEQLTNVKVEWTLLPEQNSQERVNLMMSSGEALPDVFMNAGGAFNSAGLITYGSQGMIIPLQTIIDEHTYNLQALMKAEPAVRATAISADGNIYSMPSRALNEANLVAMRFWINQKFLDALNMRMPTTTEEYYQYLVAVRDRDPNGNGRADEIPLLASHGVPQGWFAALDGFLMNAFIFNDNNLGTDGTGRRRMFLRDNGIIDVSYNKPEWRQGLEYLARLYRERLIAPESFTINRGERINIVEGGNINVVGSLPSGGPHEFSNTTGDRRTHYTIMPPLKGPNGRQAVFYDEYSPISIGAYVVTKDSKIPEIAVKWADYQYTEDWGTRNRYGVLGRDWAIPAPGTVAVDGGPAKFQEILRWGTPQLAYFGAGLAWGRFASYMREKGPDPFELEAVLWNARNVYWPYRDMKSVPRTLAFTLEEAREFNRLNLAIVDYVEESLAAFVTGTRALNDANWNNYVQQIDRLGLTRLLQVTQSAFDRSWAAALGYRR